MIEVYHNLQLWLFPSKFDVFMCCASSSAGQMELRKTRVTVLFVLVKCSVTSFFPTAYCFIYVILVHIVADIG